MKYINAKKLYMSAYISFYFIAKPWKRPRYSSRSEWINKCDTSIQWNIIHDENKWAIKSWNDIEKLKMHITKKQNYRESKKDQWLAEPGGKVRRMNR